MWIEGLCFLKLWWHLLFCIKQQLSIFLVYFIRNDWTEMLFMGSSWLGEAMLGGAGGCPSSSSTFPLHVCWFIQVADLWWVHFLWLTATILVIADSWWEERSLLECLRSADQADVCEADNSCLEIGPETTWILWLISFSGKEAVKQRVSCCLGWVRSSLFLWGTCAGLCMSGWRWEGEQRVIWRLKYTGLKIILKKRVFSK